ncbi:MAG: hypothetical protein ACPL06_00070 [Candidatus Anstonellales archaeon]
MDVLIATFAKIEESAGKKEGILILTKEEMTFFVKDKKDLARERVIPLRAIKEYKIEEKRQILSKKPIIVLEYEMDEIAKVLAIETLQIYEIASYLKKKARG